MTTARSIPRKTFAPARLVALVALLVCAACSQQNQPDDDPVALPEPITASEAERGEAACTTYAEQVCACAEQRPDDSQLAEACQFSRAKIQSFRMALQLNHQSASANDRVKSARTVRRYIKSCIEGSAQVVARGCRVANATARPPELPAPDKAAPDKATTDQAAPDKAAPDKATPDQATTDQAAP
ncbi:MAG: hypothetical protein AAGC55_15955 [Myxococcota bacterium]